jgi:hypothetical protein
MAKEKPAYRDNVERIKLMFPNKELLNCTEVMDFTGLSRNKVKKMFTFKDRYISVATLARELS